MLRSVDALTLSSKLITHSFKNDSIINPASIQCIRWKRKPRWLPMAPSRMFKIPEKPVIDEREKNELKRLHDRYKTQMHAVRNYFYKEVVETSAKSKAVIQEVEVEEDHLKCIKINKEWNEKAALIREERLKKEREETKENIVKKLIEVEEQKKLEKEKIEQLVREEKERSKFYITPENIDKAIDEALGSTVDHNYAVDLDGNIYRGRRTKPSDVPSDEMEKIKLPAQAS